MNTKSLIGLIVITAIIIWGLVAWGSKAPSKNNFETNSDKTTNSDELTLGPKDAPVKIVKYSDIQCPACAFANQVINQIINDNPGKIRLTYRHFPLSYHPLARPGALALQAAQRQDKFKQMKDALFDNQKELTPELIEQIAVKIGLNIDKYKQDIKDPKLKIKIEQDYQAGLDLGIKGTPTIYVNDQELKNFSDVNAFQAKIDQIINSQ